MEKTDNSLDFRRYWREMKRLRWVYLVAFVGLVGIVTIYLVHSLPRCESSVKVLIEDSSTDSGSGSSKGGLLGMMKMFSIGGFGSSSVDNEQYIIGSYDMAERTVRAMNLTVSYIERDGLKKRLLFPDAPLRATMSQAVVDSMQKGVFVRAVVKPDGRVDAKVVRGPRFWRTTFSEVKNATLPVELATPYGPLTLTPGAMAVDEEMKLDILVLGLKPATWKLYESIEYGVIDKLSDIVEVELEGGSNEYCNAVLGEYINQYNLRRIERRAENALSELRYYDDRLAALFGQLDDVEKRMEDFRTKNNITNVEAEVEALVENSLGQMPDIVSVQASIDYYRTVKTTLEDTSKPAALVPVVESLDNPMIVAYNDMIVKRKSLERSAKDGNQQLVALNEQIDDMRVLLLQTIESALQQATMQLNAMSGLVDTVRARLAKMPSYEREYIDIMRDRTVKNELYLFLMQKRENAALQVTSNTTLGFVIDPPHNPLKTSMVKPMIMVAAAIFMSLLLPTLLAIFLLRWRNRIEDPTDLTAMHLEENSLAIAAPDDSSAMAMLRTNLLRTNPSVVYVCNLAASDGDALLAHLAKSFERIGRRVNAVAPLADNDAILAPAFAYSLAADAINFVALPDCEHLAPYVAAINADDAALLVVLKAGAVRRPDLRSRLSGIYADRIAVAILQ